MIRRASRSPKRTASWRRRRAGGYALLEALVAVAIAAVGFVGAARMQTLGLAMNNSAQARQKATLLGYQMADRIRANQAGVTAHAYDAPAAGATTCLYSGSGCTPAQLAAADIAEWQAEIAAQLPTAVGVVCLDSTPDDGSAIAPQCDGTGNVIAVKLWWTDKVGAPRFVVAVRP
jgi:type IV pilus assembly protein PilV